MPCKESLALSVLYKEVGQMFFNDLRTKQQTGYVANAYVTEIARRSAAMFTVESSWAGPGDLLTRFETFITKVLAGLKSGQVMQPKKLGMIQRSMLSAFSKPIQNIYGMGSTLEGIIKDYDGDFNVMKKRKKNLETLTRDDIVAAATKLLGPQNKRRIAVFYTPSKTSLDAPAATYVPFNNTLGTFVKRPKYVCKAPLKKKKAAVKPVKATAKKAAAKAMARAKTKKPAAAKKKSAAKKSAPSKPATKKKPAAKKPAVNTKPTAKKPTAKKSVKGSISKGGKKAKTSPK